MATAVTISIKVDGSQANEALNAVKKGLTDVGVQGTASLNQASNGLKQMGGHAATGLDSVRLLSQEFGLRLPRAIEAMISRIPAITNGLQSVLGVMAGIAAAQVFVHVAEEIYGAYEKYVSLNAAAEKFYETIKKTSQEDVVNTHSIETTRARLDTAENSATKLRSVSESLWRQGLGQLAALATGNASGVADMLGAHQLQEASLQNQGNSIQLTRRQIDQQHELALAQIEAAHAGDAQLVGQQKINAELAKKQQIDAESRKHDRKVEGFYGNQVPGSAGEEEQRNKDLIATREADAQKAILAREAYLAITKASDESVRARLTGEELIYRKMRDDLRELRIELANTGRLDQFGAQGGAVQDRYFADLGERQVKRQNEAAKQMRDASAAGLTGAARIQAEHNNKVADINTNPQLADDPAAAAQARIAAENESNQKIAELQQQFSQRMRQIEEGRTAASLSGFQRIDAGAAKQVDELNAQYNRDFANGAAEDAHTLAAKQDLQRAVTAVYATAADQRKDLAQKNAADDLRYDQEAAQAEGRVREQGAMGWVSSYRNALSTIQAEEQEHLAKLQEQAGKEGLTYEEVERRRTDIVRTANAQIVEQNVELQHRIAGALQSAFTDPVGFIKSKMEEMMFQIIAGWVMHLTLFKQLFGSTMGGLTPGGAAAGGSAAGGAGVLGSILRGTTGAFGGSPELAGGAAASSGAVVPAAGGGAGSIFGQALGLAPDLLSSAGNLAPQLAGTVGGGTAVTSASLGLGSSSDTGFSLGSGGADDPFTTYAIQQGGDPSLAIDPTQSGGASSAGQTSQLLGAAVALGMGGYQAYNSTVSAFESGSAAQGALGDASAGAAIGGILGPEGALIGAGIGAAFGAAAGFLGDVTGEGKKLAARAWYEKSVLPQLAQWVASPPSGDFYSAVNQVNGTTGTALATMTGQFGRDAAGWVNDQYMKKEVALIDSKLASMAKGGAQYTGLSAAQFHTGGSITGFGDLATSGNEGFIHALLGETVVNANASAAHAPYISAMNAGAGASDMASMYLQAAAKSSSPAAANSGGDTHFHVHTLDTKTMKSWLRDEGAAMITQAQNRNTGRYSGEGTIG